MKHTNWVHTIIRTMNRLGGDAPYRQLKPEIERSDEQNLTPKWHQTVEGTIEQFSSDSIRGKKPLSFAGSQRDVFKKLGHGHWGIRDYHNKYVKEALETQSTKTLNENLANNDDSSEMVFINEHWRSFPSAAEDNSLDLPLVCTNPISAWCTNSELEVELKSGVVIKAPLWWFPKLFKANQMQRSNIKLSANGIHWPDVHVDISIVGLLRGEKAPDAVSPKGGQA